LVLIAGGSQVNSLGQTPGASLRFRDAIRVRAMPGFTSLEKRGRWECRMRGRTHGPPATKNAGGSHHRSAATPRHSLRNGFTAYDALSPVSGLF
jgi:hypothetical protein